MPKRQRGSEQQSNAQDDCRSHWPDDAFRHSRQNNKRKISQNNNYTAYAQNNCCAGFPVSCPCFADKTNQIASGDNHTTNDLIAFNYVNVIKKILIKLTSPCRKLITNWISTQAMITLVSKSNKIKSNMIERWATLNMLCHALQITNGRASSNRIEQRERERERSSSYPVCMCM